MSHTAEQLNKDIPNQVQVMTYKITELEKTLSMLTAAQVPRMQENITSIFSHVCSMQNLFEEFYYAIFLCHFVSVEYL